MRTSTAYFAGAGTVVTALVIGFGGSLLFANIVSPTAPKPELTKLDQRMSQQPVQAPAAPSESVKNAAPVQAAAPNVNAAPSAAQASPAQPNPAIAVPPTAAPVTLATSTQPAAAQPAAAPAPQPVVAATQPAQEPRAAPAREELQAADVKRAAEKRKADRRLQWAEKRRYYQQQRQDPELREVEEAVREETQARPRRELAAQPARTEMPLVRLFGVD